jgi:hypothetical protein
MGLKLYSSTCRQLRFPVSGIYTRMQRILYYFFLCYVFLFRHNKYLTTSAVAYVITYATIVVSQAIVLIASIWFVNVKINAFDSDHAAIRPIVTSTVLVCGSILLFRQKFFGLNGRIFFRCGYISQPWLGLGWKFGPRLAMEL